MKPVIGVCIITLVILGMFYVYSSIKPSPIISNSSLPATINEALPKSSEVARPALPELDSFKGLEKELQPLNSLQNSL